jgi:hypothetical protein
LNTEQGKNKEKHGTWDCTQVPDSSTSGKTYYVRLWYIDKWPKPANGRFTVRAGTVALKVETQQPAQATPALAQAMGIAKFTDTATDVNFINALTDTPTMNYRVYIDKKLVTEQPPVLSTDAAGNKVLTVSGPIVNPHEVCIEKIDGENKRRATFQSVDFAGGVGRSYTVSHEGLVNAACPTS